LPANRVKALQPDQAGRLWIGTARGLAVYNNGRIDRLSPESTAEIRAIGRGSDGTMYVAPADGTLEKYAGDARAPVEGDPALRHVAAIYTDPGGVIWFGTSGEGLLSIDHGRLSRYTVHDGLFDDSIYAVLGDRKGRLWMACSKGIFSIDRAQLLAFRG